MHRHKARCAMKVRNTMIQRIPALTGLGSPGLFFRVFHVFRVSKSSPELGCGCNPGRDLCVLLFKTVWSSGLITWMPLGPISVGCALGFRVEGPTRRLFQKSEFKVRNVKSAYYRRKTFEITKSKRLSVTALLGEGVFDSGHSFGKVLPDMTFGKSLRVKTTERGKKTRISSIACID
jgi:hypothetical protein